MAKNYENPNLAKLLEISKPEQITSRKFTTSRGIEVILRSVPPYLVQMATKSVSVPKPPTYDVELLGGGVETHTHDATSIEQSSDEEKKQWATYQAELQVANQEASDILLSIILLEGVDVEIPDKERFAKRMKLMHLEVPDDPDEQDLFYRKAYVIGSQDDAEKIIQIVLELTQVSGEALKSAESSFRDNVEPKS